MSEYFFTKKDFIEISEYAHKLFMSNTDRDSYDKFLTKCFVDSVKWYCGAKKLKIVNGKVYKLHEKKND